MAKSDKPPASKPLKWEDIAEKMLNTPQAKKPAAKKQAKKGR